MLYSQCSVTGRLTEDAPYLKMILGYAAHRAISRSVWTNNSDTKDQAWAEISDSGTAGKERFPHLNKLPGDTSYSLDLEEENMAEKKLFFKELDFKIIVDNYWSCMVWEEIWIISLHVH